MTEHELAKVKEAVMFYIDGTIKHDFNILAESWHPECKMFGINQESNLAIATIDFWKENLAKPITDPNYKRTSKILNVDVTGKAASAKVETVVETTEATIAFMDYLNLLKINDKWFIVNKIYNAKVTPKKK
ncbi:MAG TPA: nuclear transport factor 2 family protein [Candidatus Bathyarchaeia archaeon]|nr:nuclear transport factor 2 family protein [Candidatus Bathyarchaeia archaeon]